MKGNPKTWSQSRCVSQRGSDLQYRSRVVPRSQLTAVYSKGYKRKRIAKRLELVILKARFLYSIPVS